METYQKHLEFIKSHSEIIGYTLVGSICFYMVAFWTLYAGITAHATSAVKADPKSSWKFYLELEQKKRYLYITYATSIMNAFGCLIGCYLGASHCAPPPDK